MLKKNSYPNNVEIGERFAKVNLQSLLNHTAERIVMSMQKGELSFQQQIVNSEKEMGNGRILRTANIQTKVR